MQAIDSWTLLNCTVRIYNCIKRSNLHIREKKLLPLLVNTILRRGDGGIMQAFLSHLHSDVNLAQKLLL